MQFKRAILYCRAVSNGKLPYDYYYLFMSLIYSKMFKSNYQKALEIHDMGKDELIGRPIAKMFTYSIKLENGGFKQRTIEVNSGDIIKIKVAGLADIIDQITTGFLLHPLICIKDTYMRMEKYAVEDQLPFECKMDYKIESPAIVINHRTPKAMCLKINDIEYTELMIDELRNKHLLLYNKSCVDSIEIKIKEYEKIKLREISIKNKTYIGYTNILITITAPLTIQEIAYYCGLGHKNHIGTGFITYKGDNKDIIKAKDYEKNIHDIYFNHKVTKGNKD